MVLSESWGCLLLTYFLEIAVPFYRGVQGGGGGEGGDGGLLEHFEFKRR